MPYRNFAHPWWRPRVDAIHALVQRTKAQQHHYLPTKTGMAMTVLAVPVVLALISDSFSKKYNVTRLRSSCGHGTKASELGKARVSCTW